MNTKAMISFSFDDGRKDCIDAINLARNYGLGVTLYVTTGYIEKNIESVDDLPSLTEPMKKSDIIKLYDNGVEIGGHGDKHNNNVDNIIIGNRILSSWLGVNVDGFSSPRSMIDFSCKDRLINEGFKYARVNAFPYKLSIIKKVKRKLVSILKLKKAYLSLYKEAIDEPIYRGFYIKSIPILKNTTIEQIVTIIKYAIKHGKSIVFMFHSVTRDNEHKNDNFTWSFEKYQRLCEYLHNNNGIIPLTVREMFVDMKEI